MDFFKDPKNRKIIIFFVIMFVIAGGLTLLKHQLGYDKIKADSLQQYYDTYPEEKEKLFADFAGPEDSIVTPSCSIEDNDFIVVYTYKKQISDKDIKKATDKLDENADSVQKQAEEVIKGLNKKTGVKSGRMAMTLTYCNNDGTEIWSKTFEYK